MIITADVESKLCIESGGSVFLFLSVANLCWHKSSHPQSIYFMLSKTSFSMNIKTTSYLVWAVLAFVTKRRHRTHNPLGFPLAHLVLCAYGLWIYYCVFSQWCFSFQVQFDLVAAAFTLSELPCVKEREEAVLTLWRKTSSYLVGWNNGKNFIVGVHFTAHVVLLHLYQICYIWDILCMKLNILKMMVSRSPIMIFDCFLYFFFFV